MKACLLCEVQVRTDEELENWAFYISGYGVRRGLSDAW